MSMCSFIQNCITSVLAGAVFFGTIVYLAIKDAQKSGINLKIRNFTSINTTESSE